MASIVLPLFCASAVFAAPFRCGGLSGHAGVKQPHHSSALQQRQSENASDDMGLR
jgi:hypothetical protein